MADTVRPEVPKQNDKTQLTSCGTQSEVELLKKAAQCDPPVSAAVRQLCAARLVSGVDAACKAAATAQRPAEVGNIPYRCRRRRSCCPLEAAKRVIF
jgi:hypothetical protein